MVPIQFLPGEDIIDPCRDNVFKSVFTRETPPSRGALKRLVSACLNRNLELIAVTANEPPVTNIRDRQIRYDIGVKFARGELGNIEMTLHPRSFEPLRLEYYGCRLFTSQDIRGVGKSFGDLQNSYQIAIVGNRRHYEDAELFHDFRYYDPERGISLGGRSHILMLELEKAEQAALKPVAVMSGRERWAVFFRYATDPGRRALMNELLAAEEGIGMAGEVLLTISRDEAERARLESEYKYALDVQSDLVEARRAGIAEGKAEGRAEGKAEGKAEGRTEEKLETARRLRKMGLSPEQIAEATGLSPEGNPEAPDTVL
jgi:predicted transposase/invertase (TIGR01784 family)